MSFQLAQEYSTAGGSGCETRQLSTPFASCQSIKTHPGAGRDAQLLGWIFLRCFVVVVAPNFMVLK